MPSEGDQVTAADISRLAGVTRATVSNWRRRHPDFPSPSGGSSGSPLYERAAVEAWLSARGQLPETPHLRKQATLPQGPGMYATPKPLAKLMAALLAGQTYPQQVFDPACGTGNLLAAASEQGATGLFGQELSPEHVDHVSARLRRLAPAARIEISSGDSLRADAFPELRVDALLCNPPYADPDWGHGDIALDRWDYEVPSKGESELAWVQHCLAHLKPAGTAVLLLPPAVAERSGGRKIRAALVRRGALRAVLALPPGAAPPNHIGLHLWILRRPESRPAQPPPPILFADSSGEHLEIWRQFSADPEGFDAQPGVAGTVKIEKLLATETVDVTPSRHVGTGSLHTEPSAQADEVRAIRIRLQHATSILARLNHGPAWKATGARPVTWRTATIADLMRGGAIVLLKSPPAGREKPDSTPSGHDIVVLTSGDVVENQSPSGDLDDGIPDVLVKIRPEDVILTEVFMSGRSTARVADQRDIGAVLGPHLYVFRLDTTRLDPWFVAGFLASEQNLQSSTTGSRILRVDPKRLRVPLIPMEDQRVYGKAFRRMAAIRRAANLVAKLTEETARQHNAGLSGGTLLPPGID